MLKLAANASNAVEHEPNGMSEGVDGPPILKADKEPDLESRWLPVALCLVLSDSDSDA